MTRRLHLAADPAAAQAWCRAQLANDCLYVAPSAAARRHAILDVLGGARAALGATVVGPGRLVGVLEAQAWLEPIEPIAPTLERLLCIEAARDAGVPLFEREPPAGAVRAVQRLFRSLRLNACSAADYEDAGGDHRAAAAFSAFELRRAKLGQSDEADRLRRVIDYIPALGPRLGAVILEDPSVSNRLAADLYRALAEHAGACHVALPALDAQGPATAATAFFRGLGMTVTTDSEIPSLPSITAVAGPGADGEVDLVARTILALLRSGTPAERILGVAPNAAYLDLLHRTLVRLGAPVASPRRLATLDVPLVRALLGTFQALANEENDTAERGLALLGMPHLGLTQRGHDVMDRLLVREGLGSLRTWRMLNLRRERHPTRRLAEAAADLARELEGRRTPGDFAAVLSRLAFDFHFLASGRKAHLAAGREDAVRVDQQAWDCVIEAVAELGNALGTTGPARLTAREWLGHLHDALGDATVRLDARAVRGLHLTVAGGGLPAADHVFAVGWREGVFPRRPREDPLLADAVKRALGRLGALLPLAEERVEHDRERRERIVRAARKTLTVSYPASTPDGAPALPSFYLADLGIERPAAVRTVGETTWSLVLAATRGERLAHTAFAARHVPVALLGDEAAAVRSFLGSLAPAELPLVDGRRHAAQRLQLPEDVKRRMAAAAREMSASQARQIGHCLYSHFGKRRLALEPLAPPDVGVRELGTIAHRVLADLGRAGLDPALLDDVFDRHWEKAVLASLGDLPSVAFERERLRTQLAVLVESEDALIGGTQAEPSHFELAFGLTENPDEPRDPASISEGLRLQLPRGSAIDATELRGSIDRVDVVELEGQRYGVAIDYKTGSGESYGKEFAAGTDLQLTIYCDVLPLFGIEPAGAFYLGIDGGERFGVVREDAAEAFFGGDIPKGVRVLPAARFETLLARRRAALADLVAKVARAELSVDPRNGECKYCDLRAVCRIGTFAVAGKGSDDSA